MGEKGLFLQAIEIILMNHVVFIFKGEISGNDWKQILALNFLTKIAKFQNLSMSFLEVYDKYRTENSVSVSSPFNVESILKLH